MSEDKRSGSEELAIIGRSLVQAFKKDLISMAIFAAVGAGLCYLLGFSVTLGALVGAFIGLAKGGLAGTLAEELKRQSKKKD